MRAWHAIDREFLFWDCLRKVRDGYDVLGNRLPRHPRDFDAMTVDEVLKDMMTLSKGHLDPRTTRERLAELDDCDHEPEWRRIAFYLADCHAETALYDGTLKSCSKARRDRFRSICEKALGMLKSPIHVGLPDIYYRAQNTGAVLDHLESALRETKDAEDRRDA